MRNYCKVVGTREIEEINLVLEETFLEDGGYIKLPTEVLEMLNLSVGDTINFILENTEIPIFTMLSGEDETLRAEILSIPETLLTDSNMSMDSNLIVTCDDGIITISETNEDFGVGYYVVDYEEEKAGDEDE